MERDQCFVCGVALASIVNFENNWRSRTTGAALLENNLDVIFLLRKLLQVPGIQLECQLAKCGDNPERWISLCDQCTQLIKKARELDEEIQRIEGRLRSIKKNVLQKISGSASGTTDDKQENKQSNSTGKSFGEKIRSSVINSEYTRLNDEENDPHGPPGLVEGDQLAKYLDSQGNHCTAAILLVEKPCEEHQDDIKVEQESPPVSPAAVNSPPDQFVEDDDPDIDTDEDKDENFKGTLSCSVCNKIFSSAGGGLRRHVRVVHEKQLPITCPLCPMAFESKMYMQKHLLAKHKDGSVTKEFQEQTGFNEIKVEQESPPMSPDHFVDDNEDDPSYDSEKEPDENVGKADKGNCSCPDCGQKFNSPNSLGRHMKRIHKKQFQVNCPLCAKGFRSQRYVNRHLLGKHKDDPLAKKLEEETGLFLRKCSVIGCVRRFIKQADEDRHMKEVHDGKQSNDKRHKCQYCGRGFWDKGKCRRHEKIHEEKGKVRHRTKTWSTARKAIGVAATTTTKITKKPYNFKFKCDTCGKGFRWAKNWSEHLWDKHEKRDITCPGLECGKIFNDDLVEFQKHWKSCRRRKSDGTPEKHLCSFCGKEFMKRSGLSAHLKRHSRKNKTDEKKKKPDGEKSDKMLSSSLRIPAEGQFNCVICEKDYKSQRSLWTHNRQFHRIGINGLPVRAMRRKGNRSMSSSKVLCNICGKEYSSSENLKTHVKFVHDKEFSLSCHVCGLGVVSREHLNKHLLARHRDDPVARQLEEEEGLKLRKCPVVGCVAKFLRDGALDKHVERFHGGGGGSTEIMEPRFKCKYCGRGYWLGNKLKRHERMHEGKGREDWKCGLCGKGFGTKEYLRYHELFTHKLSKKFQKEEEKVKC